MSTQYQIQALPRTGRGTSASRANRRSGQVPAVIYGAGKDNQSLLLNHNEIMHNLETEGFQSAVIEIKTDKGTEQAILRDVQMHPYKDPGDAHRFSAYQRNRKITHCRTAAFHRRRRMPGVYNEGGIASHLINEVDIECLPADLPEYLEVDISTLELHESAKLTDIKVPAGVEITALAHGGEDQAVATIMSPQREEVDEEVEGEEELEAAEGEGEAPTEAGPESEDEG